MQRIAILTGGGDCPGLNAVIRAVVKTAYAVYRNSVVGIEHGYNGLLQEGGFRYLYPDDVAGLLSRAVDRILALDWRPVLGRRTLPEDSPIRFFFPSPASGSACKRWNLYLRWRVRKDEMDFGLWRAIPTRRLVIPTDTHVHRVARRLGLTRRKAADWKTAREITDRLARFDPEDPVRYDYALCELGTVGICRPSLAASLCSECALSAACPAGRKRITRAA